MPYRTMDNRIDGVVITFADITAAKKVEASLREKNIDLNMHSAEQGRALDRAEERLQTRDARQQLRVAKDRKIPRAVRAPEKAKT
jgi:hypothetical protein